MTDTDYHGYKDRIFTDEHRLAVMLSLDIEPQHGGGSIWEVHHPKGGRWFVSALTGKMNEVERLDGVCTCDGLILAMQTEMDTDPENFLPEATRRVGDYLVHNGNVDKCLQLIEERKSE